jgi:hypothetical protein
VSSSAAVSRACSAALRLAFSHWPEPSVCSGALRLGAGIARDDVQLRYRHEQLGVVGVVQFEEFLLAGAEIHADQAR